MSIAEHTSASLRADAPATSAVLVSIVIPCLNEAENIEECVTRALTVMGEHDIAGEVVVADNDSEDDSAALATAAGARVVHEPRRGYGSAYLAGFAAARGKYVIMADADLTYDFNDIPRFLAELESGADLVMGDRMDNIQPGTPCCPGRSTSSSAPACATRTAACAASAATCCRHWTCARPAWSSRPRW
jgi:glycosyltransferase involved in cell wall biosynthesis